MNAYQRFVYLFPHDGRVEAAMFQIGVCYMFSGQFDRAVQSFSHLMNTFEMDAFTVQAYFRVSDIYVELGKAASAITTLQNLAKIATDFQVRDECYYRIGWIYLERTEWEQARVSFDKISPENAVAYRLRDLVDGLQTHVSGKKKHPGLAGMLSIIPGGGQVYCERYQDALIAFLLNGGLIYAAYEAFDRELYALAGVIAFVEVGFYSGNIYGAVSGAHKYNRRKDRKFIEQLRENVKISLSARPATRGVELALGFSF